MAKQDIASTSSSNLALNSRTMKALGLKQQPFTSALLSDKTFYTDSILNKQFETIKHHLQFSDLILIVEGVLGSGKTILFRRLFHLDIASLYLMPIQAEATDTLVQLQQKMTIHMQNQGNANYLDDNLKNLQVFDQTPVLIIDDAHVLSDNTLQELLRYKQQLATEKQIQLKLLLLANKGMAKTLEHISDLEHSQLYVQEMPKFNTKQILAFIAHRMKLAGAESLPQLNDASLKKLAKKTEGIPAVVMSEATRLINGQSGIKSIASLKLPSRSVLTGTALIVLLAIAGWFIYPIFNPQMADISSLFPLTDEPIPAPKVEPLGQPAPKDKPVAPTSKEKPSTLPANQPETLAQPEPLPDSKPLPAPQPETLAQPKPLPAPLPEPIVQTTPEDKPVAPTPKEKLVVVAPTVKPPIVKTPPKQTPNIIKDPALKALANMGVKDHNWLLQQNKNYWTLQVLGARDPQTLVNFMQTHHLEQDTAWYRTKLNNEDWYVLVHRFYTDRDIARNAISRLPAPVRQARPWVRSLDSIQKAMN